MRAVVVVVLAACAALAGCTEKNYFECEASADCDFLTGGTCIQNPATGTSWCAAPDATCPSGYRWDATAVGDNVASMCTPTGDGPISVDAAPCEQRIAFLSERDGVRNVFTMNPEGTDQINISAGGGADLDVAWSPRGDRLAYSRTEASVAELWVVNYDGSDNHRISEEGVRDIQAIWTPDGQTIVFARARTPSAFDLWSIAPDGSGLTKLTVDTSTSDHNPTISPNGQRIAFVATAGTTENLYVMSLDGTNRENLTDDATSNIAIEDAPQWSPDSASISFVSNRSGDYELWSVSASGANLTNLSQSTDVRESHPRWFPDGTKILFGRGTTDPELWTMNDDGSGQTSLDVLVMSDFNWGEVSPDARYVAFTSFRDGDGEVYRADVDGTNPVRLTSSAGFDDTPLWRPCP